MCYIINNTYTTSTGMIFFIDMHLLSNITDMDNNTLEQNFTAETVRQKYFLPVRQKYLSPLVSAFMTETPKMVNCFPVNINIPVSHVIPAPIGYLHPTSPQPFSHFTHTNTPDSPNTPTTKASTRLQVLPLITFQQIVTVSWLLGYLIIYKEK